MLSGDRDLLRRALQLLYRHYGRSDLESSYWTFDDTDYYSAEMGDEVERQFVCYKDLIKPDTIAEIKRQTNEIEKRICDDLALPHHQRPVNLDPGYLSLSKVVLATTKDRSQRIYLERGIYAEVTMIFKEGRWQPWPWTFPDYASGRYNEHFLQMRNMLKDQLAQL